jgi:hypothetical protein
VAYVKVSPYTAPVVNPLPTGPAGDRIDGQSIPLAGQGGELQSSGSELSAQIVQLGLVAPATLGAGSYSDTILITACYDNACTNPAHGSPLTVPIGRAVDPTQGKGFSVQTLPVAASAISWSPTDQKLYAIVPSYAPSYAGSLVQIDPVAASIVTSISLGSGANPSLLAISDDGQYAYVGQEQSPAQVQRVRLADLTIDQTFQIPAFLSLNALRVAPGASGTVAVETYNDNTNMVIYDQGVARSQSFTTGSVESTLPFTWGADSSTLYAYDNVVPVGTLYQLVATNAGVSSTRSTAALSVNGAPVDLAFAQGLFYASTGAIINPSTEGVSAEFTTHTTGGGASAPLAFAIDTTLSRAFFLNSESTASGSPGMTLESFDLASQKALWISRIASQNGTSSLVRWGNNGIAYLTNGSGTTQLVLMSGALITQ